MLHISTYQRLKAGCHGSTSTECQTINRIGGTKSGMPTDDPKIQARKIVANYDSNDKVVSYTLIDRNTYQPIMIMEPLDYAAYRNASPGIQMLMQSSPQYALDFSSAGLYTSVGDNGRAVEHMISGSTSRDYVRDVGLGVAGAAISAATVAKPSLATTRLSAEPAISSRGVPDALQPEADFAGRGLVRADLSDHLLNGAPSGKQIAGSHDLNNFTTALSNAGGTELSRVEKAPGIYEIEYQLPKATKPATKTVYDPIMYPKMSEIAETAASKALIQFQQTGELSSSVVVNGIKFTAPIRIKNGVPYVPTVFPTGVVK